MTFRSFTNDNQPLKCDHSLFLFTFYEEQGCSECLLQMFSYPSVILGAAPPQAKRKTSFSKGLIFLTHCSEKENHSSWRCSKFFNFGPKSNQNHQTIRWKKRSDYNPREVRIIVDALNWEQRSRHLSPIRIRIELEYFLFAAEINCVI